MVTWLGLDEAGKLAWAFSDLEDSFRKVLYRQFPRQANPALTGPMFS